jgi:hypothetical protein
MRWRVIVVGGHTRSIGKTQLVCELISVFPEGNWVAGKITQYGHGVCAQNGENCDCAPEEHVCAISWEQRPNDTDSGRFLTAGAHRSFWLRTKQGFLAEGLPLLRSALREMEPKSLDATGNLILESNTLLQFLKPSLYLMVLDPTKADFKESARMQMDRASSVLFRNAAGNGETAWSGLSVKLLNGKPQYLQRQGDELPVQLRQQVQDMLRDTKGMAI